MTPEAPLTLVRYQDVREALHDPRLVIHKPLAVGQTANHLVDDAPGRRSHRVRPLRRSLAQHLAPRRVEQLADFIESTVDRVVTEAESVGSMEIVRDLAFPLPVAVMGELLGLPRKDHAQLRPLFEAITRGHDMGATEQARQHARFAQTAAMRWIGPELRRGPPSPMLKSIWNVADAEGIDPQMIDYWCLMLLYAGSATTRDLIANAVGLLLERPADAQRLADDEALILPAIEEVLRFDGPVRGVGRVATEDLTIGESTIARGDLIYLMLADANRDPEHFTDPDRFDLTRSSNPHLAFGMGVTHCLGAQLARLEARIVLARLRKSLPLATTPDADDWSPVRLLRQRNTLTVMLSDQR